MHWVLLSKGFHPMACPIIHSIHMAPGRLSSEPHWGLFTRDQRLGESQPTRFLLATPRLVLDSNPYLWTCYLCNPPNLLSKEIRYLYLTNGLYYLFTYTG